MNILFLAVLFFSHAEVTTSAPATTGNERRELQDQIKDVQRQIESLNTDLSCQKKSDCDTLGLGRKQCGGPVSYVIVSKKNRSYAEMQAASQKHQTMSRDYNQLFSTGMMGTCSMAPAPSVDCVQKRCVEIAPD